MLQSGMILESVTIQLLILSLLLLSTAEKVKKEKKNSLNWKKNNCFKWRTFRWNY